jgi:hypothetical protein
MWSLADPVNTPAAPAYWPGQKKVAVRNMEELDVSQVSS